jgi:hypothetical protein
MCTPARNNLHSQFRSFSQIAPQALAEFRGPPLSAT